MATQGFHSGVHYWEIRMCASSNPISQWKEANNNFFFYVGIDNSTDDMIGVVRSDCNITGHTIYNTKQAQSPSQRWLLW